MTELQRLRPDHAEAVLDFECVNRAYFAASITDRGDEFFAHYDARHLALVADQRAGRGAYHVLMGEDGSITGRVNLIFVEPGVAELGYRVAEPAGGRGLATWAVRELCRMAASAYGVRTIRAATSLQNLASQRVLTKAGFDPVGPAEPADLGGRPGTWYQRVLS